MINRFRSIINKKRGTLVAWFRKSDVSKVQIRLGKEKTTYNEADLTILNEYDKTLKRIDNDNFGKCTVCNSELKNNELELDFTKQVCIDCYNSEEKKLLERDLEMAAKVQSQLLPNELPVLDGFQISVDSESAGIVGGDYFDFFCGTDNKQGIVIGDVMGKGLSASMLMANIQASLRILGPEHEKMNKLAERINELFRFNSKLVSFISLFIAKLNTKTGQLEYCNAGHNPPLLFHAANKEITLLKPTGPAIGLASNPNFKSESLTLHSGDVMLMYTDGLIESRNNKNEEFSQEKINNLLAENYSKSTIELLSILKNSVKIFSNGIPYDDMTLIVLKKL